MTFVCELRENCNPDVRAKIEKDLARIAQGKLPLSPGRSTWNRGYGNSDWRVQQRKDAELARRYTEAMGFPPNNAVKSAVRDQFTYSPNKRNRQAVLASAVAS